MSMYLEQVFDHLTPQQTEMLLSLPGAEPKEPLPRGVLRSIQKKAAERAGLKSKHPFTPSRRPFAVAAACVGVMLVAMLFAVVIPMLGGQDTVDPGHDGTYIPPIPTVALGDTVTGKPEISWGTPGKTEASDSIIAPGFHYNLVIEAQVLEILPDTYYTPDLPNISYRVARLAVLDTLRGEGLPQEIFFRFPYYSGEVLQGFDCFIFSLRQIGVENYLMISEEQGRITYFSDMFQVERVDDLGYGSVIAFNDGTLDESFWDALTHFHGSGTIKQMLDWDLYPVNHGDTVEQAKDRILAHMQMDGAHISGDRSAYVTTEDIFLSDEARALQQGVLTPSPTSVFMQKMYPNEDRVIAIYTRVINGCVSDEVITFNAYTGEVGEVARRGEAYSAGELSSVPDLGAVLKDLDLSAIKPPHTEITEGMRLQHATATGAYRKIDGELYGVIRLLWQYTPAGYGGVSNVYSYDDCYFLYDAQGNGRQLERDAIREILGEDDSFICKFGYGDVIIYD